MFGRINFVMLLLINIILNAAIGQTSRYQIKYDYGLEAGVYDFTGGYYQDDYKNGFILGAQATLWPLTYWGLQLGSQYFSAQSRNGRMSMIPVTFSILLHIYNPKLARIIKPYMGAGLGRYNLREKLSLSGEKINYTVNGAHAMLGIFIGRSAGRGFVFQAKYSYVPFDHPLDVDYKKTNLNSFSFTGGYRF